MALLFAYALYAFKKAYIGSGRSERFDAGAQDLRPKGPSTLHGLERYKQGGEGCGVPKFMVSDSSKFVRLGRCPVPSRGNYCRPGSDALPINASHDRKGEIESNFEIPWTCEVDLACKIRDVRKIDGFDSHSAWCLLRQLPLQIFLNATSHDQNFSSGPRRLSEASKPLLLVIIHTVQRNPGDVGRCRLQVDPATGLQCATRFEQPSTELMGTGIFPSPRSGQFRDQWKVADHVVIPNRVVAPPVKYFLHWIAEDDGRQNGPEMTDHGMLIRVAVLIFVDNDPTVACEQRVVDMPTGEKTRDRRFDCWVVPFGIPEVEVIGSDLGSRRKGLQDAKGPTVDRRQPVTILRHPMSRQPMPERGYPRVGMGQDKDRFRACMVAQCGNDQLCLAAACGWTLLRKSADGRFSPFPRRIYPTAFVTGMPRAV